MKEIPTYTPDFEEYIRQGEPDKKETRERILRYLKGRPWADNEQLSKVLKISMSTARYHLRKLQAEGIIARHYGIGDRGNCWEIIKE